MNRERNYARWKILCRRLVLGLPFCITSGHSYADRANCNPNTSAAIVTCSNSTFDDGCGPVDYGTANCVDNPAKSPAVICSPNNCDRKTCVGYVCDDGCGATENGLSTLPSCNKPSVNQPPSVNAGPDQTITLPAVATLAGTATDDGLPNPPGKITTTWSVQSGPGTVTIANPSSLITTASFSKDGSYVLLLTGYDGQYYIQDSITITVNPEAPNQAPVITNAGPDQTITLPAVANLTATVTDDGLPTPPNLTQLWTMSTGPGTVTFSNPTSADTTASFSQGGTYNLILTASDGALTTTAPVTITVQNPSTICGGATAICGHVYTGEASVSQTVLSNISVQLRASDTGKVQQTVLTDNNGYYEFSSSLSAGQSFYVTPVLNRLQTGSPERILAVVPAENNDFHIIGIPAFITVTDTLNTSVFISTMSFHAGDHSPTGSATSAIYSATLGSSGNATFKVLGGQSYYLTCWKRQSNGSYATTGSTPLNGLSPLSPMQSIGKDGSIRCGS